MYMRGKEEKQLHNDMQSIQSLIDDVMQHGDLHGEQAQASNTP